MKRERLQKKYVKHCVDLVQLIKNRPRNTPYNYQNASCSRRRLSRNFSSANFASTSLHYSRHRQQCQCFLPQRLQQSTHMQFFENDHARSFFNESILESRTDSGCSDSEDHSLKRTSSNPELGGTNNDSQFTLLSYEVINNFLRVSNTKLIEGETCDKEDENEVPSCATEALHENENKISFTQRNDELSVADYVVNLNELIPPVESILEIASQHSAAALNFSNANETENIHSSSEESPSYRQSPLQQQTATLILEETVSRQMSDEEAGGDGPHNNIIEIEITLQSSNEMNSEEEDDGDDNEEEIEGSEE